MQFNKGSVALHFLQSFQHWIPTRSIHEASCHVVRQSIDTHYAHFLGWIHTPKSLNTLRHDRINLEIVSWVSPASPHGAKCTDHFSGLAPYSNLPSNSDLCVRPWTPTNTPTTQTGCATFINRRLLGVTERDAPHRKSTNRRSPFFLNLPKFAVELWGLNETVHLEECAWPKNSSHRTAHDHEATIVKATETRSAMEES